MKTIEPGATIGILGGGQLGRMSALAARMMGYRVWIVDPDPDCPAAGVADRVVTASLDDPLGVAPLADECQVVTYEFENIDADLLRGLSAKVPVRPSRELLEICQNRILEKRGLSAAGVPVAPWRPVADREQLIQALEEVGLPAILKTAVLGYDGKGQLVLHSLEQTKEDLPLDNGIPCILEGFVRFEREISVMVARNADGEIRTFPVVENMHHQNILAVTIAPARIAQQTAETARQLAVRIAESFDLVGILGVEMFLMEDGSLLVNELAPRPHNSGHYTMDACVTSQFEQHIRAVCNLPLGDTALLSHAVMVNIMGEDYPLQAAEVLRLHPGIKLHLYGKREARPHRKMGHMNLLGNDLEPLIRLAEEAKRRIKRSSAILPGRHSVRDQADDADSDQ